MTETITVAIVAAVGSYIGSVYAFSCVHPRAPDATAQAYRDMLAALGEYRSACLDMTTANDMEQEPTDAMRATFTASEIEEGLGKVFDKEHRQTLRPRPRVKDGDDSVPIRPATGIVRAAPLPIECLSRGRRKTVH